MRPATVAEACRRFLDGQPWDIAMGDFLQGFYAACGAEARGAMLAEEPPTLGARHDALVGAVAEYLFKRWSPDQPPSWIADRGRYLDEPWFPNANADPALMGYLTFASPAEFKSRNVMVDDEPLRRANKPPEASSRGSRSSPPASEKPSSSLACTARSASLSAIVTLKKP